MIKLLLSPRTKRGLSRAGLRQHLEFVHGPLCLSHEEIGGRFIRYIHHYTQDGYETVLAEHLMPDRDVVTCICFEDEAALKATFDSQAFPRYIVPDEDNFRELQGSIGFKCQEWIVLEPTASVHRKLFVFRHVPGNPDEAAAQWATHLATGIGDDPTSPIASCTVNSARSSYTDTDVNQIDEIGLRQGADLTSALAIYTALAGKEFGNLTHQMLMTEPKVFKSS